MNDAEKTKQQLIKELEELRKRVAEFETTNGVHKLYEEALQISEERYRMLAENVSDVIWTRDLDLKLTYVSPSVEKLRGYSVEEAMAQTIDENMTPASGEIVRKALAEELAMEGREQRDPSRSRTMDVEMKCKDGSTVWVEVRMTAIRDSEGRLTGILGVSRDISERKMAEDNLRQYQFMVESAHDAIFLKDLESRYLAANTKTLEAFGLSCDEVIGRNDYDLMPDHEEAGKNIEDDQHVFKTGKPREITKHMTGADGREYWFQAIKAPRFDNDGNVIGLVGIARDITDRKQAEEALRKSEERYRRITETVTDYIYTAEVENGRAVRIVHTPACEAVTGYTPEEFEADPNLWIRMVPEKDLDVVRKHASRCLSGDIITVEHRIIRKDGAIQWVRNTPVPQYDDQGNLISFDGLIKDITERKSYEEAIHVSEERYRLLAENVTDVIWTRDLNLKTTYISPSVEKLRGYSVEEVMAQTLEEIMTPASVEVVKKTHAEELAIEGREQKDLSRSRTIDLEMKCKDGSTVWVEVRMTTIRDSEGRPTGILGVSRDVTERKITEKALRESEEKYRALVERAIDGIVIAQGTVLRFANNSFAEMLGYEIEELIDTEFIKLIPPENRAEMMDRYNRRLAGEDVPSVYETTLQKRNGERILVELNAGLIQFEENVANMLFVRDISERKQAEEEKDRLEEQLHQSQKMEAIGRLAGGVAHDFNNLLTAILGYAYMTTKKISRDDPLFRNMEEIRKSAERAADLTNQLLAFSRRQIIKPKILNLNTLISNADKLLRRVIGEDIGLITFTDGDMGSVKADPGQMEQVILNLAVNARDAMKDGGSLTIETRDVTLDEEYAKTHPEVTPGEYVMLAVADTGCGMTEGVKENIFEPFFTTKEEGKGTGLGLSTAYGIVKQHGGTIGFDSKPGEGTTFKIYLPREEEEPEPTRKAMTEGLPTGSETVLVVEDEDMVRDLISNILKDQGYHVLEARRGVEALQVSDECKDHLHLLVTDVIMPEMNGKKLAEKLMEKRNKLKVLFISGYTDDSIAHHGVLDDETKFLPKPFTPAALVHKVREVLDG